MDVSARTAGHKSARNRVLRGANRLGKSLQLFPASHVDKIMDVKAAVVLTYCVN